MLCAPGGVGIAILATCVGGGCFTVAFWGILYSGPLAPLPTALEAFAWALLPSGILMFLPIALRNYWRFDQEQPPSSADSLHLWFCHEKNIEQAAKLEADDADLEEQEGRISRIKRSIFEQGKEQKKAHASIQ